MNRYQAFTDCVIDCLKKATPCYSERKSCQSSASKNNSVVWWDSKCARVIRLRKAAFKKWQFSGNLANFIAYKKRCALVKRTIKQKKRASLAKFAKIMRLDTDPKYVWRFCKVLKNKWTKDATLLPRNQIQRQTQARTALDKLSPLNYTPINPIPTPDCQNNDFLSSCFNFSEFNIALESKNQYSTLDKNGIDFEFLSRLPISFKLLLLDIFNEMYSMGEFPVTW